jgi:hypothetical protein
MILFECLFLVVCVIFVFIIVYVLFERGFDDG